MPIRLYLSEMTVRAPTAEEASFGIVGVRESALVDHDYTNMELVYDKVANYALIRVEAADHTLLLADARMLAIPKVPLATELTPAQRSALINKLAARGVTVDIPAGTTLRQALTWIGKRFNSNFSLDRFIRGAIS